MAYEGEKNRHEVPVRLLGSPLFPSDIPLLRNRQLSTLALRQRDPRLDTLTNNENVRYPEQEKISKCLALAYDFNS